MYLTKGLAEGRGNTRGSESEGYLRDSLFLSTTLNSDLLVPGIGIPFLVPSLLVHPRPTLTHPFRPNSNVTSSSGTFSPCSPGKYLNLCFHGTSYILYIELRSSHWICFCAFLPTGRSPVLCIPSSTSSFWKGD